MNNSYRLLQSRDSLDRRVEYLHRNQLLAIGILDCGTQDQFMECLQWYSENMNCALHAVISADRYDTSSLQQKFPMVTFIIFSTAETLSRQILAVADESQAEYFMIVRSDCSLVKFDGSKIMKYLESDKLNLSCIVPCIANQNREIIPSIRIPGLNDGYLDIKSDFPQMGEGVLTRTLYPVFGIGIYNRAKYQRLRGLSDEISSEYWQLLDWGIRVNLQNNTCMTLSDFIIEFPDRISIFEDVSDCEGMDICYTDALAVRKEGGRNVMKKQQRYFSRDTFNEDVKNKLVFVYRKDYEQLCAEWSGK